MIVFGEHNNHACICTHCIGHCDHVQNSPSEISILEIYRWITFQLRSVDQIMLLRVPIIQLMTANLALLFQSFDFFSIWQILFFLFFCSFSPFSSLSSLPLFPVRSLFPAHSLSHSSSHSLSLALSLSHSLALSLFLHLHLPLTLPSPPTLPHPLSFLLLLI